MAGATSRKAAPPRSRPTAPRTSRARDSSSMPLTMARCSCSPNAPAKKASSSSDIASPPDHPPQPAAGPALPSSSPRVLPACSEICGDGGGGDGSGSAGDGGGGGDGSGGFGDGGGVRGSGDDETAAGGGRSTAFPVHREGPAQPDSAAGAADVATLSSEATAEFGWETSTFGFAYISRGARSPAPPESRTHFLPAMGSRRTMPPNSLHLPPSCGRHVKPEHPSRDAQVSLQSCTDTPSLQTGGSSSVPTQSWSSATSTTVLSERACNAVVLLP